MIGAVAVSVGKTVFERLLGSTQNDLYPICYLVFTNYDGSNKKLQPSKIERNDNKLKECFDFLKLSDDN